MPTVLGIIQYLRTCRTKNLSCIGNVVRYCYGTGMREYKNAPESAMLYVYSCSNTSSNSEVNATSEDTSASKRNAVLGGMVGYPRACKDLFKWLNFPRVHVLVGTFS